MKTTVLAILAMGIAITGFSQTDSTHKAQNKADTIKIGGTIIINKSGDGDTTKHRTVIINHHHKNSNVSTNWFVVDLGFANFNDKTAYASAGAQAFAPGSNSDWFKLRNGKSVNVNVWFFMQQVGIIRHYLNFKYGLGVELNNYRFDDNTILFQTHPTMVVRNTSATFEKNKLAADYLTLPAMLNVNLTPGRKNGFGFSGGVSAGYLYSARQKLKYNGNKEKTHNDFDLNKWKLSYVGELNLGVLHLYGSYAFKSMWTKGLDQTPYTVGIRLGH